MFYGRDFYYQKEFQCEITGHQQLTFFDAFQSETNSTRHIDESFPEPLRGPVLKKVQHSQLGRLEHLVNWVYDAFKQDFFPREHVIANLENGDKADAIVREKTSFSERMENGAYIPARSTYLVSVEGDPAAKREPFDIPMEAHNLYRDRRNFSKLLLRSFLKGLVTKEPWLGAPWVIKDNNLALQYGLPTEIPPHLQHDYILQQRKAAQSQPVPAPPEPQQTMDQTTFFNYLKSTHRLPKETRGPSTKGSSKNHRFVQQDMTKFAIRDAQTGLIQYQVAHAGQAASPWSAPGTPTTPGQQVPRASHQLSVAGDVKLPPTALNGHSPRQRMEIVPTPPPAVTPIKFPCEDTEVPPRSDAAPRPALKFFSEDTPAGDEQEDPPQPGLRMSSVGTLLEIWDSLNVHSEVFLLDSFTLDDLGEAMRFNSPNVKCELLDEVHCAVLKQLLNGNGEQQVTLPEFEPSDDEESGEEEEEEEDEPEPEPVFRRTTRSSLKKDELAKLAAKSPTPEEKEIHRAAEMLVDRPWKARLKERDFKNGGWQVILVGILHQLSLKENKKERCEEILKVLAPMDEDPTDETAKQQYFTALDINLRLEALQMIVMLATGTQAIRRHLEDMSAEMTTIRKNKIEQQRLKKDLMDELHRLVEMKKELQADIDAKQPKPQTNGVNAVVEIDLSEVAATNGHDAESHEGSDDDVSPVKLRRGDRKRKREEVMQRKQKAKREKMSQPRRSKEEIRLEKLEDELDSKKMEILECEDKIAEYTSDLRETDCQRTRVLGRDRFCNRYVWFERNGMPFGGVPDTSTAHYQYVNGRIWVQGPSEYDIRGLIDIDHELQAHYVAAFDVTTFERREKEEGSTRLENDAQWGYLDSPADVDKLLSWLDERGVREKALKKELLAWREVIVDCMRKMHDHLSSVAARREEGAEDSDAAKSLPTRVSTRTKTYVELDRSEWPCLAWRNSYALDKLGIIHSDGMPAKRGRGRKPAADKVAKRGGKRGGRRGS